MKPLPPELDAPAWLHGESAFTTVRTHRGEALGWAAHRTRLRGTCAVLGLAAPGAAVSPPPLEPLPWGLLRVTVTAAGTFFTHRALNLGPRPTAGVTVAVTGVQVHPQLAAHKTGNYLPYRLAARVAAAAGAFEGWLLDAHGYLVDGARTSPLLELGGQLVVPAGGLPGVTRAALLAELARPAVTRPVHARELAHVTRAWVCGSGVGAVPVRALCRAEPDWAEPAGAEPAGAEEPWAGQHWTTHAGALPTEWPATTNRLLCWPGPLGA